MEAYNPSLKALLLEVVGRQIEGRDENGNPCDTLFVKEAFERLNRIYGEKCAKEKIASVLIGEMYDAITAEKPFDNRKYAAGLEKLK